MDFFSYIRDSWQNVVSGLGTKCKDNVESAMIKDYIITPEQAAILDKNDKIVQKINSEIPNAVFTQGYEVNADENQNLSEDVKLRLDELDADGYLTDALIEANISGSALIWMVIDDDLQQSEPINWKDNQEVKALYLIEEELYSPNTTELESDFNSPNFGNPIYYDVTLDDGSFKTIHVDRLLVFNTKMRSKRLFKENNYKGYPLIQPSYQSLQQYRNSTLGLSNSVSNHSQKVFTTKGLIKKLADKAGESTVLKRIQSFSLHSSLLNTVVIDSDEEDFKEIGKPLSGVADGVEKMKEQLVADSGIPHTVLFGESPSGLGATGNSEKSSFYGMVANQQNALAKNQLKKLATYVAQGISSGSGEMNVTITFRSPYAASQVEVIDARLKQSQIDKTYADMGFPETEIFKSRFGGEEYSYETRLDERYLETLEQEIEQELEQEIEQEVNQQTQAIEQQVIQEQEAEQPQPEEVQEPIVEGEENGQTEEEA